MADIIDNSLIGLNLSYIVSKLSPGEAEGALFLFV